MAIVLTTFVVRQEEDCDSCCPLQGMTPMEAEPRAMSLTGLLQEGKGLVKVNGKPLSLVQPEILRFKVYEPLLILGLDKFGTHPRNTRGGKKC